MDRFPIASVLGGATPAGIQCVMLFDVGVSGRTSLRSFKSTHSSLIALQVKQYALCVRLRCEVCTAL